MQASNRTFICSVVFLDIVGYSKKPVIEQIQLKERLNNLLTEALANVAVNDRIILDTGDGAALSFLGDPEDALFVCLSLRDALLAPQPHGPGMSMRMGVNLGPVKLVKDINGQPNIIGDGINVAQRVMSFSQPGQVLVSRSYYEVVSCLSEEYGRLFHYEGARTDKHVREHEVYAVEATGDILLRVAAAAPRKKEEETGAPAVMNKLSHTVSFVTDVLLRKPQLATVLAVVAILAVAVTVRANREAPVTTAAAPEASPATVATAPAAAPPPAQKSAKAAPVEKPAKGAPKPAVTEAKPALPAKSAPIPATTEARPVAPPAAAKPVIAAEAPPSSAPQTAPQATPPRTPAAGGAGLIRLTITPWGTIYVDGVHRGDTPPVYELRVSAGTHRLEIRHPDFPAHVRTIEVTAGGRLDIRHTFLPKEQPNPLRNILPWQ